MMESSRRGGHVLTTIFLLAFCFQVFSARAASPALSAPPPSAKPALLNSYLPAAMQVLAHLTHQMSFERPPADSLPAQASKPPTTTTRAPTTTKRTATTTRKTETTAKTTVKMTVTTTTPKATTASPVDLTTPPHAPANFAPLPVTRKNIHGLATLGLSEEPLVPPIVLETYPGHSVLTDFTEAQSPIPVIRSSYPHNSPHYIRHPYPIQDQSFPVVLFPSHTYFQSRTPDSEPMFLPGNFPGNYNQDPLYADYLAKAREGESEDDSIVISDGLPDVSSLPVQNENNYKYNPLELMSDELSDENLQYLAPSFRELIKGINAVDDREEGDNRYNPHGSFQSIEDLTDNALDKKNIGDYLRLKKAAATQSYIQMLLLYDLLSRDAKTQKLNNYTGYSKDLLKDLVDISQGTAAEQLATILNRMVVRGDCKYDFANNRAKELVTELGKPGSKASMEVRYLEPLRFLQ